MWVYISGGFVSAVEHRANHKNILIRARNKSHLVNFIMTDKKIFKTPEADYLYRSVITKRRFEKLLSYHAKKINYDNFKNSIKDEKYHELCTNTWWDAHKYQYDQGREE